MRDIHVDDTGRPTAVLDFGFFTTAGDPAFEAAVTAAVWDMYGPHAEHHTTALTTYDLFSPDGSDGHFHWCAALLRGNQVTGPTRS